MSVHALPRDRSRRGWPGAAALALAVAAACTSPTASQPSPATPASNDPSPSVFLGGSTPEPSAQESLAPSAPASGLSGTWDGDWQIDPPYSASVGEFTMELVQTGTGFTGSVEITNTDCSDGTVEGTVDGSTITFGWVLTPQPVQFSGTLRGDSMSGTWSALACSDATIALTGTWQATKEPDEP